MGLLDGNRLQRILGRAFKGVYDSGVLLRTGKVRQPIGTVVDSVLGRYPI